MRRSLLCWLAAGAFAVQAHAGVVANSNFTLVPDMTGGANYRFTAYQDEAGTDPTDILVALNGQNLLPVLWAVDEEADYYLVPSSVVFSAATIALGNFPALFILDHPSNLNVGFGDFYLGINTGQGISSPGHPKRDVFGWVHLRNDPQTGLTMLGNAMSYGSQGIIVGTTVAVPEPTVPALLIVGLCLAVIAFRKQLVLRGVLR